MPPSLHMDYPIQDLLEAALVIRSRIRVPFLQYRGTLPRR